MSETRTRTGYYQDRIDSGAYTVTAVALGGGEFSIYATLVTETREQAAAARGLFPKSVGARATTLSGHDYYDHEVTDPRYGHVSGLFGGGDYSHAWIVGYVAITFNLTSNRATGWKNETALKRYRSFRRNAARLGIPVVFEAGIYSNSVQSEADLDALLADYAKAA